MALLKAVENLVMFIHMATVYGGFLLVMGVMGNEYELAVLGLAMMFLGNLHRLGKMAMRRNKYQRISRHRVKS